MKHEIKAKTVIIIKYVLESKYYNKYTEIIIPKSWDIYMIVQNNPKSVPLFSGNLLQIIYK